MIDRSRKHRLNASCQCCRLGEARPFRGAVFLRIRAADRTGSPSESSIRFVSWSFRPQAASGGRGASPPVPRPAGCRRRRRLRRLDFYFIIFRSASASFRPQLASGGRGASPPNPRPAGCRCRRRLRRPDFTSSSLRSVSASHRTVLPSNAPALSASGNGRGCVPDGESGNRHPLPGNRSGNGSPSPA